MYWSDYLFVGVLLLLAFALVFKTFWQTRHPSYFPVVRKNADEKKINLCFTRTKPQWVTNKVIYLKALNPDYGCRKIAHTFNRLYEHKNESVSKSFVYNKIKTHQYQILLLRRKVKHQRPAPMCKNKKWGIDLTTIKDITGKQQQIFAVIDYGTRKCLCFEGLRSKHSSDIIWTLLKTMCRYGKPNKIKSDNEPVFASYKFNLFLWLLNIQHQYSDIASPWQNGRIERLIGTFKERINQLLIRNTGEVKGLLPDFEFWYNSVRPHNYLDGKTPDEVWYQGRSREFQYWQAWDGLLT